MRLLKSCGMASLVLAFGCKRISSCLLAKSRRGGIGRRAGLKIQYWQQCVGSIPSVGRARQRPTLHVWNTFLGMWRGRVALPRDRRCTSGTHSCACGAVGLRSRATGVARPEHILCVCGAVGLRSRATCVACPDAHETFYPCFSRVCSVFTFYGRATPDAQERIPTTPHARPRHTCTATSRARGVPLLPHTKFLFSSTS